MRQNAMLQGQPVMHDLPPEQRWYRQPGYRPTNLMLDMAAKYIAQPIYDLMRGDLHNAANEYELGGRGYQKLPGKAFDAAGAASMGSFGMKAPAGALRSGAARPDLDMSQAARLQRARDMGFDTETVLYHGTSPESADEILKDGFAFKVFMTPRREIANDYGSGSVLDLYAKRNKLEIDLDLPGGRTLSVDDANGYLGNDGWTISDYINSGYSVAADPSSIRSVNAAFDPARSTSSNLMAANRMFVPTVSYETE